jgi:hypothetical protein
MPVRLRRLTGNPLIRATRSDPLLASINGSSLIRVPEWIEDTASRLSLFCRARRTPHPTASPEHLAGLIQSNPAIHALGESSGYDMTLP